MTRIAVGGFQHETNTFAPHPATLADFEQADGWPPLVRGQALLTALVGGNIPVAGFIRRLQGDHELLPLVWCSATPSGPVTADAFETIAGWLLDDLRAAAPVDGVYLDLHGAMVTEHLDDGEGELLRRVRALIGPDVPLVASLDFHANVSPLMMAQASALVAYRTYPHVDHAHTGARVARLLRRLLAGQRLYSAFQQLPFLIPIITQSTLNEPMVSLMAVLARLETTTVASLSFTPGFPLADVPDCGPAVFGYGSEQSVINAMVAELARAVVGREADFQAKLYGVEEAVQRAIVLSATARRPVILADTQDNPGGGGVGDTVGLLQALLRQQASGAVLGLLYDPVTAAQAQAAGVGAEITVALGARSGFGGEQPVHGRFLVERLGDGNILATGPYLRGCRMQLGPMALLRQDGVRVVVASRNQQAADQALFRHLGVEPAEQKILALKSSVHFRADFEPLAAAVLLVAAPGPNVSDPAQLPYRRLRRGMRLGPLGKRFGVPV